MVAYWREFQFLGKVLKINIILYLAQLNSSSYLGSYFWAHQSRSPLRNCFREFNQLFFYLQFDCLFSNSGPLFAPIEINSHREWCRKNPVISLGRYNSIHIIDLPAKSHWVNLLGLPKFSSRYTDHRPKNHHQNWYCPLSWRTVVFLPIWNMYTNYELLTTPYFHDLRIPEFSRVLFCQFWSALLFFCLCIIKKSRLVKKLKKTDRKAFRFHRLRKIWT